jgi:hypothetical protein
VAAAAAWYWLRPLRVAAIAGAAGAAGLLVASISEWNIVSDDVSSVNLSNGIYATARVAPGLWILLTGAAVATVGALWTLRVER